MDPDVGRALDALRRASEEAPTLDIRVTDDYLRLIEEVEALPQNQSGADKSGVWRAQRAYLELFKMATLVRDR